MCKFSVTQALAEQRLGWADGPYPRPNSVYKTRENLPTRPPPGSSGCSQEKLNTLSLAKTRRPHLAWTWHLLPRPLASILRVGCNKTPSSQNFKDLVPGSPETTPSSCACAVFASSSVAGPALCPLLLTREELGNRALSLEHKRTTGWPDALMLSTAPVVAS